MLDASAAALELRRPAKSGGFDLLQRSVEVRFDELHQLHEVLEAAATTRLDVFDAAGPFLRRLLPDADDKRALTRPGITPRLFQVHDP